MPDNQLKDDYIQLLTSNEMERAFSLKNKMLPNTLFRYEKFDFKRLTTLENGHIYLSNPGRFNDIYDSVGLYYSDIFKQSIMTRLGIAFETFKFSFDYLLAIYYESSGIACFTEDRDNFPMWWSYADNHSGFCVEYDIDDAFKNNPKNCDEIFPVIYSTEKANFDKLLIRLTDNAQENEPLVRPEMLLFHILLGTTKHKSWSYEREWRCIRVGAHGASDFAPKVKAVYLGSKFDITNIPYIESIARKRNFNVYQLSPTSFEQKSQYSF